MEQEIWKDIEGFEGCFQVSNLGRVRSLERIINNRLMKGIIKKTQIQKNRFEYVNLRKAPIVKLCTVHRLVAKAFIPNPNNLPEVNHKDFNRANNNANNLEWVSGEENRQHFLSGIKPGSYHNGAKLTEEEVLHIRKREVPVAEYAKLYGLSLTNVYHVQQRKTWKHI